MQTVLSRRLFARLGLVAATSLGITAVLSRPGTAGTAPATGPAVRTIPLDTGWSFAAADATTWTTVTLPHTVTPLSWRNWSPADWERQWRYRRDITLPADDSGLRYFLRCAGSLTATTPSINGHALPQHLGGYLPFDYELTPYLHAGTNQLDIALDGGFGFDVPPDRPGQASSSVDYWQPAGLYREVSLDAVPTTFLADVFGKPVDVLDSGARRLDVQATVDSAIVAGPITVDFTLWQGNQRIGSTSVAANIGATGAGTVSGSIGGLGRISLWELDSPTLYQLVATLRVGGVPVHDHQVRIGFRQAEFTDGGFFLNGNRVQLFGLNRHQFFPFLGGAAPARVQRRDVTILREVLRCNMVRLSHYPQHEAFLDACDELGLLVWEEAPGWGYLGDAAWLDNSARDVGDMIIRDRNHPSIVTWGVRLNETPDDTAFYTRTQAIARSLDDSRPTTGGMVGGLHDDTDFQQDVFGYNDYSASSAPDGTTQPELLPPRTDRPYLVSETIGTLSGPAKYYRRTDSVAVQQGQALAHARVHSLGGADPRYAGVLAWCGFDYPSGNGNISEGVKWPGVVDVFRVPKPGAAIYRSQVDPRTAVVIEPAFYWDFQEPWAVTSLTGGALICANAQRLELYLDGAHFASLTPDTATYPNLPHPPFRADFTQAGPEDLRIDAYVDGHRIGSRTFSADRARDRLAVSADDTGLTADGSDATRVQFQAVDVYGAPRPYTTGTVTFSLSGPTDLVGDNPFPFADTGGAGAVWVRGRAGQRGVAVLRATHDTLGSGQVRITVT
ncbi:MAG TPA: glycoside hydrolase family 2 TIM barrel-domain containing protein [Pseudonocardiaceae bacterium]|nr:glycoside hydrolase family 2 TIM barrel-domain containing protein [Pseudonocardiaceae bacterium]